MKKIDGIKESVENKFFYGFLGAVGFIFLAIINGLFLGIIPAAVGGGVAYFAIANITKSWEISTGTAFFFAVLIFVLNYKAYNRFEKNRKVSL